MIRCWQIIDNETGAIVKGGTNFASLLAAARRLNSSGRDVSVVEVARP